MPISIINYAVSMRKYFTRLSGWVGGLLLSLVPILVDAASSPSFDDWLARSPGVNLTIGSLFGIIAGLACWSTRFITVVMVVMIIWYGFQMMASQSNETKFTSAKKSLGYAVVGMIVVLGAYTIIATVANTIEGVGQQNLSFREAQYTMFIPLSCGGY